MIRITKQPLVSGGGERLSSAEMSAPQEIFREDGIYDLHKDLSGLREIFAKEKEVETEDDVAKDAVHVSFIRSASGWNLEGGAGPLFGQRYFSREHSEDGAFSFVPGNGNEQLTMILRKGETYTFTLVDPFRKPQAEIKIKC